MTQPQSPEPQQLDYAPASPADRAQRGCLIALLIVLGMVLLAYGLCFLS